MSNPLHRHPLLPHRADGRERQAYRVSVINSSGMGTASNVATGTTDLAPAPSTAFGHNPVEDFNTLETVGNYDPRGIWSDGTTMWVADENDGKIYAHYMPPGS